MLNEWIFIVKDDVRKYEIYKRLMIKAKIDWQKIIKKIRDVANKI